MKKITKSIVCLMHSVELVAILSSLQKKVIILLVVILTSRKFSTQDTILKFMDYKKIKTFK